MILLCLLPVSSLSVDLPMSGRMKPLEKSVRDKGKKGRGRRSNLSDHDKKDVVRFRTFPSEITRRLLATMVLARDNPRAFLIGKKRSGSVGLVEIGRASCRERV